MGNCESKKEDCLFVIHPTKDKAENGFDEFTSSNYPDILPVGEVNRLISRVNCAVRVTKYQKEFMQLTKWNNFCAKLWIVSYFISIVTVPVGLMGLITQGPRLCPNIMPCWSFALGACKYFKINFYGA